MVDGIAINGVRFADVPLAGKEFSRCAFTACDFSGVDLAGSEFSDCAFGECNFSNTAFAGCRFLDPVFEGCKLAGLALYKADQISFSLTARACKIVDCNFSDIKAKKSVVSDCVLSGCDFVNADFESAVFAGSEFSGCVFHNANLRKADFTGARGYEINPQTNDVRRAVFSMPHVVGLLCGLDIKIKD
jgi:uncharacterized protein YjbI with pentapeptide repeats